MITGKSTMSWINKIVSITITNPLISNDMEFLTDLWQFLKERKKWWLLPIILILLFVGILVVFGSGSALAPFIYTIF